MEKLEIVLQSISDQWTTDFNQALSTISKKYNLPKQAFMTVDQDFASFFGGILNRPDIGPALFKGPFTVTTVTENIIASFIHRGSIQKDFPEDDRLDRNASHHSTHVIDPALAVEAIFFSNKV